MWTIDQHKKCRRHLSMQHFFLSIIKNVTSSVPWQFLSWHRICCVSTNEIRTFFNHDILYRYGYKCVLNFNSSKSVPTIRLAESPSTRPYLSCYTLCVKVKPPVIVFLSWTFWFPSNNFLSSTWCLLNMFMIFTCWSAEEVNCRRAIDMLKLLNIEMIEQGHSGIL